MSLHRLSGRCRLVVLGVEVGGRWDVEATRFLRLLARSHAGHMPEWLKATALLAGWSTCTGTA